MKTASKNDPCLKLFPQQETFKLRHNLWFPANAKHTAGIYPSHTMPPDGYPYFCCFLTAGNYTLLATFFPTN